MKKRVVITGMGAVTPIGNNVKDFWDALLRGDNGIDTIKRFDVSEFSVRIGAEVKNFDPTQKIDRKETRRMDRFTQYALYASSEAIEDSKLLESDYDKHRVGILIASGIGGIETLGREFEVMKARGVNRVSPFLVPMMIPNIAGGWVSIKFGFKGPNFCVVSACASASHAIGESYRMILRGEADVMITGGSEAPFTPLALAGFSNMKALSTRNDEPDKASRPFDRERDGFVMGEGAGILILEELEHARRRGARIYAEIVGYGATADAYHITAPEPDAEGPSLSIKYALEDGGVKPEMIDYINAHGTSTPLNDKVETLAIKKVFGDYAYKIPISSTKSMIGHLLGAAGGVEAIATILSIHEGKIHKTRNYENPDPDCDLYYVPDGPIEKDVKFAISNSFGFGGHNATLLFKKFEE